MDGSDTSISFQLYFFHYHFLYFSDKKYGFPKAEEIWTVVTFPINWPEVFCTDPLHLDHSRIEQLVNLDFFVSNFLAFQELSWKYFFKQIWSRRLLLYTNLSSNASPCYFTINVNCGPFMYCIPLKGFFALMATCLLRIHNSSLSIKVARNKWPKFDEAMVFGLCLSLFSHFAFVCMHCDTDQKLIWTLSSLW